VPTVDVLVFLDRLPVTPPLETARFAVFLPASNQTSIVAPFDQVSAARFDVPQTPPKDPRLLGDPR
jgi:hypothetical protein